MSEKRYVIVSPSHHKKPRAMFLNNNNDGKNFWLEGMAGTAYTWLLSDARKIVKYTPIGCYFVEYTESMQTVYGKAEQGKTYFDDFMGYSEHFGHEVICDWRQSESANPPKTQEQETPAPEEKREYVLYRNPPYSSGFIYYERGGMATFDKSEAYVMTYREAVDKIKELSAKGEYQWVIG